MAMHEPLALAATRRDGWNPERQRIFLEVLAETGVVRAACDACGLSARSAYNLRFRADGAAFRLGWDAAVLIARARLADELMTRAIEGQEDVLIQGEDGMVTRRRHDNRLAMSMLSRLDRMAGSFSDPGRTASDGDAALARIVAQDFEAFLDMIARGEDGGNAAGITASAALFLAARRPGTTPERIGQEHCELCELDDELEAPPLVDPTPEGAVAALRGVWWCGVHEELRTDFPPPPGFDGVEELNFGDPGYNRVLSDREQAAQRAFNKALLAPIRAATAAVRDEYFGFVPRRPRKRRAVAAHAAPDTTPSPVDHPALPCAVAVHTPEPLAEVTDVGTPYRTVQPWPKPATHPTRPPAYAEPF